MARAQQAWQWFVDAAPWIVLVGLPSIVNALAPFPKAQPVATFLSRVLVFARALLDRSALLSHQKAKGTFKAPFRSSEFDPVNDGFLLSEPDPTVKMRKPAKKKKAVEK